MIEALAKINKNFSLSFLVGSIVLAFIAGLAIVAVVQFFPDQNLAPTPLLSQTKSDRPAFVVDKPCVVGTRCEGPEIQANDPEGDDVTYRVYDKETNTEVTKSNTLKSGTTYIPKFSFSEAGEKQLYVVVEDGAGHKSPDYPVVVKVVPKDTVEPKTTVQ